MVVVERDVVCFLFDVDVEELRDICNAQLIMFVFSLMFFDVVERFGVELVFCAGYSLGEYTVLIVLGVFSFDEGVWLVCEWVEVMHDVGIENLGIMVVVFGLDDD